MPVHPHVVTIRVGPVGIDPNPLDTRDHGLFHNDGLRWWWSGRRGSRRCGLLNHDDGLPVDLLCRARLRLDDHIGRRLGRLALLPRSRVTIV